MGWGRGDFARILALTGGGRQCCVGELPGTDVDARDGSGNPGIWAVEGVRCGWSGVEQGHSRFGPTVGSFGHAGRWGDVAHLVTMSNSASAGLREDLAAFEAPLADPWDEG